jgi:hypothetical protein
MIVAFPLVFFANQSAARRPSSTKSGCLINHLQSDRLFDLPSGVGADNQ